jgi:hypothetical protein
VRTHRYSWSHSPLAALDKQEFTRGVPKLYPLSDCFSFGKEEKTEDPLGNVLEPMEESQFMDSIRGFCFINGYTAWRLTRRRSTVSVATRI